MTYLTWQQIQQRSARDFWKQELCRLQAMFMCNQTKVNGENSPLQYNKTGFYHTHTLRVYGRHIHTPYDSPQYEFSLCSVTCCTKLIYTVATDYQAPSPLSTYPSYKMYTGETDKSTQIYTLRCIKSLAPTDKMCSGYCQEDARQGTNKTSLLGFVGVPELY